MTAGRFKRPLAGLCLLVCMATSSCSLDLGASRDAADVPAGEQLTNLTGSGTARVTGVVLSADIESSIPVGGARVTLGDAVVHTNVDGSFSVEGVPAGETRLTIDGRELLTGDGHFGQFDTIINFAEEEERTLETPIYLPFVSLRSQRTVQPVRETIVTSVDGVTLHIQPGAARERGEEYEETISIQSIPIDRPPVPLPARFTDRIISLVTIQPLGINFQVPVPISFPTAFLDEDSSERFFSVWGLDGSSGEIVNVGVAQRVGDRIETVSGGVRWTGWHFLTDLEFSVREPCDTRNQEAARICTREVFSFLDAVGVVAASSSPGALTVFGRLNTALGPRGNTVERARTVIDLTRDLFPFASDAANAYQNLYQRGEEIDALRFALASAEQSCVGVESCGKDVGQLDAAIQNAQRRIEDASENVELFQFRMDRLQSAVASLEPFYTSYAPLPAESFGDFRRAATDFTNAYRDGDTFESLIGANDALIEALLDVSAAAREMAASFSQPAGTSGQTTNVKLMRVCDNLGTTSIGSTLNGYAPLRVGDADGRLLDECVVVAMNMGRRLTSMPLRESELLARLHPPLTITLGANITASGLTTSTLQSGVLTLDSPVHFWELEARPRQELLVSFASTGDVLAGMGGLDGSVYVAREGGFRLANLSSEGTMLFQTFALEPVDHNDIHYSFGITPEPVRLDFDAPITGRFDVHTRSAGIIFDAQVGDTIVIERQCCDPFAALFSQTLLGPGGVLVPPTFSLSQTASTTTGAFEAISSGIHRLLLHPHEGAFADYEMAIRFIEQQAPQPIELATDVTGTLNDFAETAVFRFVAGSDLSLLVEGLSSTELDPVLFSVIAEDGTVVVEDRLLFFDDSSFARQPIVLPAIGVYEIIFRIPFDGLARAGSFTFRVATPGTLQLQPAPAPELEVLDDPETDTSSDSTGKRPTVVDETG